ncbi:MULTISPECIES: hypothetical protein [Pseudomonas]|uniref:hypothetical protein n=1 Tax=Pseudomonas TaxID=286 RepID=UPI001BE52B0D|nr:MULTISPECIES: hypothetical protein [Pseudomonas]MBT2337722.1 hypothetical protein [Pseudomonas fluorescens]MCD4528031.1 hypothetical protein [Pseudomonas sp. C3-2018]
MRRAISITVLSAVAGLAQAENTNSFDCSNFLQFGANVDQTRAAFAKSPETMAWNWFVCLNQPATTGSPNLEWETMKPSDQVYLPNGAPPGAYGASVPPPDAVLKQAQAEGLDLTRTLHNLNATQQVDGLILQMGGAVPASQKGSPVRFQLLMGQDTFDYIVQRQVYNMNGQAALPDNLVFPSTAWELKSAWLWIGTDTAYKQTLENDGYYIAQAYYQQSDGTYAVGYAALSGLHVVNKLNANWVWTTFENINNSKYTVTNAPKAEPMTNTTGPTPAAKPVNAQFQASNPTLSKYELIGVEFQPVTQVLANSQLESAFQSTSSCLACHGTAAYSTDKGYFNFAIPHQGGIAYPTTPLPDSAFAGYKKLDFVWSLKRAQWQR